MKTLSATLAVVNTYTKPEGCPLAVGSVISYEDMANPRRTGTIVGFRSTRWGTSAVVWWEPLGEDAEAYGGTVEMGSLQYAIENTAHAGFRVVTLVA